MALSNAERQRRYRERRRAEEPIRRYAVQQPQGKKRSRPQRWAAALDELRTLQEEYQEWLDNLPEALAHSATAEKLQAITELDLEELDVELPRGFGRDG